MSVTSFVIDRSVWLRGEGGEKSMLLRPDDGKKCCLGIYLEACGVPIDRLAGHLVPNGVGEDVPGWTTYENDKGSTVTLLMKVNDDEELGGYDRERRIAKLFAQQGVAVSVEG